DLRAFAAVMRRGQLFVLTRSTGDTCPIIMLDPTTNTQVSSFKWRQCQWPVVALDPTNDDLILQDFIRSKCSPCALDGHAVVDYDPGTGTSTTLVGNPLAAYSEAITTSPDGQWIFVAEEPADSPNTN